MDSDLSLSGDAVIPGAPALETYLVLFALTSVSFLFKHASHFSALQIRWDPFFCFSVLPVKSSPWKCLRFLSRAQMPGICLQSGLRQCTVCFLAVQINHYNRSYLGYCSFLQIQYSLAFGHFVLHFSCLQISCKSVALCCFGLNYCTKYAQKVMLKSTE